MEYKERTYRQRLTGSRWHAFTVAHKETDLWVGVDHDAWHPGMPARALAFMQALREEMEYYLAVDPAYATALTPYPAGEDAPGICQEMARAAGVAGIGPMSAVAGAVARRVGEELREAFHCREVLVENGGDIYALLEAPADIAVFAGESPLSGRVGFTIKPERSPLGICTSSGTVGPSLSFGKADAITIVCRDCALADAYATAFGNRVQGEEDVDPCIEAIGQEPEILAAICIKGARVGVRGEFDLKIWKS
jgi:ApbE superfamily uncharacterized protein (UPF0280 family)